MPQVEIIAALAQYLKENYSDITTTVEYTLSPGSLTLFGHNSKTIVGSFTYIEKGLGLPDQTILVTINSPQHTQELIQISNPYLLEHIKTRLDQYRTNAFNHHPAPRNR